MPRLRHRCEDENGRHKNQEIAYCFGLEKKPWTIWTILKILPRQNLQCREMEGLQATATPHSFLQSRQTLREDFLLSQPANDEHGLKVVEKG